MGRVGTGLLAALVLGACSPAPTVQAHAFSSGFKAGRSIEYRVHTTVSGGLALGSQQIPLSSDQVLTERLTVTAVDKAGDAIVQVTTEGLADGITGAPATSLPPDVEITVAPDGRILSGAAAPLGSRVPSVPGSDQLTPILAGHPVKVGDRWTRRYDRPNPYGSGGFSFTTSSTYLRDETVGGSKAAVIQSTLQGPIDFTIDFARLPQPVTGQPAPLPTSPVHYTGTVNDATTYWIDLATDEVLKSSATGSYNLGYQLAILGPSAGTPQQVTFNGQIKSEVTKL